MNAVARPRQAQRNHRAKAIGLPLPRLTLTAPIYGAILPNMSEMADTLFNQATRLDDPVKRAASLKFESRLFKLRDVANEVGRAWSGSWLGYQSRIYYADLQALGHNSKAVHRAYAKRALVKIPSLEEYEKRNEPRPAVPA